MITLFEVKPGPTLVVYVDGRVVAEKRLGLIEMTNLVEGLLRNLPPSRA